MMTMMLFWPDLSMETITASGHEIMELEVNNNETLSEKQSVKESEGGLLISDKDEANESSSPVERTITVTDPEEWLCVAKLPLDTTEETFHDLLSDFGCVKDSFLLVSSKTGKEDNQVLSNNKMHKNTTLVYLIPICSVHVTLTISKEQTMTYW